MSDVLAELRVFCGQLSSHTARVYAQLPAGSLHDGQRLEGRIRGPHSALSRTLPAESPLRFQGLAPTPLASAVVPDPTCWSPEIPAQYRVTCEVREGDRTVASLTRWIGLRGWSVQRRSFHHQGSRRVVRAARAELDAALQSAPQWREHQLALLVDERPPAEWVASCCEWGLPLLPRCAGDAGQIAEATAFWSRWAAVSAVLIDGPATELALLAAMPRDVLRIQVLPDAAALPSVEWAEGFALEVSPHESGEDVARRVRSLPAQPVLACLVDRDDASAPASPAALRKRCEQLQRKLAPSSLAGYLCGWRPAAGVNGV